MQHAIRQLLLLFFIVLAFGAYVSAQRCADVCNNYSDCDTFCYNSMGSGSTCGASGVCRRAGGCLDFCGPYQPCSASCTEPNGQQTQCGDSSVNKTCDHTTPGQPSDPICGVAMPTGQQSVLSETCVDLPCTGQYASHVWDISINVQFYYPLAPDQWSWYCLPFWVDFDIVEEYLGTCSGIQYAWCY